MDGKVENGLLIVPHQRFGFVGRGHFGGLVRLEKGWEFHHCFSKFAIDAQSGQKISDNNNNKEARNLHERVWRMIVVIRLPNLPLGNLSKPEPS